MEDYIVETEGGDLLLERRSDEEMAADMDRLAAYRKKREENEND